MPAKAQIVILEFQKLIRFKEFTADLLANENFARIGRNIQESWRDIKENPAYLLAALVTIFLLAIVLFIFVKYLTFKWHERRNKKNPCKNCYHPKYGTNFVIRIIAVLYL